MTSKMNFTVDEWKILADAPLAVGTAVATAVPSGMVGTVKEGMTLVNQMTNAAKRHPHNQLIQEVVPKGVSRERIDEWANIASTMMQQSEAARAAAAGVEMCQKVAMILQNKADPQEADEFKRWLLEIGEDVAKAAREGRKGESSISPQEAEMLNTMSSALGLTHIPSPPSHEGYLYP
jgi:hypothetical protein